MVVRLAAKTRRMTASAFGSPPAVRLTTAFAEKEVTVGLRTMLSELKDELTGARISASIEEIREATARVTESNRKLSEALLSVLAEAKKDPVWGERIVDPVWKALELEPRTTAELAKENEAELLRMLATLKDPGTAA